MAERIKMIRELNEELEINTAILADLQGPKLRVGVMGGEAIVAQVTKLPLLQANLSKELLKEST